MKRIGNFEFVKNDNISVLNYKRTAKDWFDIVVSIGISAFFLVPTLFVLDRLITHFSLWLLAVFAVFAVVAGYTLLNIVSYIFMPMKEIVLIDKTRHIIVIKTSLVTHVKFAFSEIAKIRLSGTVEKLPIRRGASRVHSRRFYCAVNFVGTNGEVKVAMPINTDRFVNVEERVFETELYSIGKKIAMTIATDIDKDYQWTGFKYED